MLVAPGKLPICTFREESIEPSCRETVTSVNTVDVLYAALPAFLYLNPEIAGYLLSPLLEYQDSPAYTQSYAAKNIGSSYPNATADGITTIHDYRIEGKVNFLFQLMETHYGPAETANMLIMTLAYSQRSGNGTFLSKHVRMLTSTFFSGSI